jgi:hypothetical protein
MIMPRSIFAFDASSFIGSSGFFGLNRNIYLTSILSPF